MGFENPAPPTQKAKVGPHGRYKRFVKAVLTLVEQLHPDSISSARPILTMWGLPYRIPRSIAYQIVHVQLLSPVAEAPSHRSEGSVGPEKVHWVSRGDAILSARGRLPAPAPAPSLPC